MGLIRGTHLLSSYSASRTHPVREQDKLREGRIRPYLVHTQSSLSLSYFNKESPITVTISNTWTLDSKDWGSPSWCPVLVGIPMSSLHQTMWLSCGRSTGMGLAIEYCTSYKTEPRALRTLQLPLENRRSTVSSHRRRHSTPAYEPDSLPPLRRGPCSRWWSEALAADLPLWQTCPREEARSPYMKELWKTRTAIRN